MGSNNSASARSSCDDDVTVDELMEALAGNSSDPGSVRGFMKEMVEFDPNDHFEEMIAPELLFPDEADGPE